MRFFAVDSDGCSPACDDREKPRMPQPNGWKRRGVQRSLSAEDGIPVYGRPTTPDCINRLDLRLKVMRRGFSFCLAAFRYLQVNWRDLAECSRTRRRSWGSACPFAGLLPLTADAFALAIIQPACRSPASPHRPFSSVFPAAPAFCSGLPTQRGRMCRFDFRAWLRQGSAFVLFRARDDPALGFCLFQDCGRIKI